MLLDKRKFAWAMIPAFLIPHVQLRRPRPRRARPLWVVFHKLRDWVKGALVLGAAALGYVVFLSVLQSPVGTWKAEFLAQSKYGNGVHDPLVTLLNLTLPGTRGHPGRMLQTTQTFIVPYQALLVLVMMIVVTYVMARHWNRLTVLDQLVACWTYVFWLRRSSSGSGSARTGAMPAPLRGDPVPVSEQAVLIAVVVLSHPVAYVVTTQVMTGQLL